MTFYQKYNLKRVCVLTFFAVTDKGKDFEVIRAVGGLYILPRTRGNKTA